MSDDFFAGFDQQVLRVEPIIPPKVQAELDRLRADLAAERARAEQHAFTLRQFLDFVQRERALRDAHGKGGQHTGNSPSISPSVLHELERYTQHAPSTVEWVGHKLKKAEADLAAEQARAEKAEAELTRIDNVMARRPALDKPTRWENVEYAINTAKRADEAERLLEAERAAHQATKAECERAWVAHREMWQERYDALNVKSRDGLLASEWVARTGKAERERDEARALLREVEWGDGDGWCRCCGGFLRNGHEPACRLATLLGDRA